MFLIETCLVHQLNTQRMEEYMRFLTTPCLALGLSFTIVASASADPVDDYVAAITDASAFQMEDAAVRAEHREAMAERDAIAPGHEALVALQAEMAANGVDTAGIDAMIAEGAGAYAAAQERLAAATAELALAATALQLAQTDRSEAFEHLLQRGAMKGFGPIVHDLANQVVAAKAETAEINANLVATEATVANHDHWLALLMDHCQRNADNGHQVCNDSLLQSAVAEIAETTDD